MMQHTQLWPVDKCYKLLPDDFSLCAHNSWLMTNIISGFWWNVIDCCLSLHPLGCSRMPTYFLNPLWMFLSYYIEVLAWPVPATPSMALLKRAALLVLLLDVVASFPHPDKRTNKHLSSMLLHPKGLKDIGQLVSMKKPEALLAEKPQARSQEARSQEARSQEPGLRQSI